MLGEKPSKDAQVIVADDLFNAAKAATKARREKSGRPPKRKDVTVVDNVVLEEEEAENTDPAISQTPQDPKRFLRRKSRMILTRRMSQDGQDDILPPNAENSEENLSENIEEYNPMALRRSIRPPKVAARTDHLHEPSLEENDVDEDNTEENVTENLEKLKLQRRSVRPRTKAMGPLQSLSPNVTRENESENESVKSPAPFQPVVGVKHQLNTRNIQSKLDKIQRAPTPSFEDFRVSNKGANVGEYVELDMTFHPNAESTRVGLNPYDLDLDNSESSPRKSSRKRSASRLKKTLPLISEAEDDQGSYIDQIEQPEQLEEDQSIKRLSQEMMPPPSSIVVPKPARSHRLDSVLEEEPLITDASVVKIIQQSQPEKKQGSKRKTKSKSVEKPLVSDRELVDRFQRDGGLRVGDKMLPMLRQTVDEIFDNAMENLYANTEGRNPKLGDWKELFQQLGLVSQEDPDHRHLYAFLRKTCTPMEIDRLIPRPLMDGSGQWSMDRKIWSQKAEDNCGSDDDDDELKIYGARKKKSKKKSN